MPFGPSPVPVLVRDVRGPAPMPRPGWLLVWLIIGLVLAVLVAILLWERVPTVS